MKLTQGLAKMPYYIEAYANCKSPYFVTFAALKARTRLDRGQRLRPVLGWIGGSGDGRTGVV